MLSAIESLEQRRLLAAGDVDRSFGVNGKILGAADLPPISQFSDIGFHTLLPLKDGKFLAIFGAAEPQRYFSPTPAERIVIARFQSNGLLDSSFGDDGYVLVGFDDHYRTAVTDAQLDSRGRIVLLSMVGDPEEGSDVYTSRLAAIRLNANGSYDTTFDSDGRVFVSDEVFEIADYINPAPQLEVTASNQIVAAASRRGTSVIERQAVVFRLRESGSRDSSFGGDGEVSFDVGQFNGANELEVQTDGRILVGVAQHTGSVAIYRLRNDGSSDSTFDGDGRRTIVVTSGNKHEIFDLAVFNDGRIVVSGNTFAPQQAPNGFLAILKSNGRSDSRFGGNGLVTSRDYFPAGSEKQFSNIYLDGSTLYAAAVFQPAGPTLFTASMLKIKSSGQLEGSFGTGGIQPLEVMRGRGLPAVRLNNGKFIGAGVNVTSPSRDQLGGGSQFYRLNSNATPDSTFKNGGLTVFGVNSFNTAVDTTGRLIATGGDLYNPAAVALKSNGDLDSAYGAGGFANFGFDTGYYGGRPIAFSDGRVLLAGNGFDQSDGDNNAVLTEWLLPTGVVDTRFPRSTYNFPSGDETGDAEVRVIDGQWTSAAWQTFQRDVRTAILFGPDGAIAFRLPWFGEDDRFGRRTFSASHVLPIDNGNGGFYVAGDARFEYTEPDPADIFPVLARFTAAGVLDESFGNGGFNIGFAGAPLFAQNDGSLIFKRINGGIARLKANNTIDSTFGNAGAAGIGFDHFEADLAGRIIAWRQLIGGAADGDVQVMRFTRNGKTDTTFGGGDGLTMIDTRLSSSATANLLVTPGDDLVITSLKQNGDESANWFATRLIG